MHGALRSYAVFCDDIRQEINGKLLLIGAYQGGMYFTGDLPWQHQQLSVLIFFREKDVPKHASVKFVLQLQDNTRRVILWEAEGLSTNPALKPSLQPFNFAVPDDYYSVVIVVNFTQLVFDQEGVISALAYVDGREILIDNLMIMKGAVPPLA